MAPISRRDLLLGSAAAGLLAGGGCSSTSRSGGPRFAHGVASGDPWPDSVLLWTRLEGVSEPVEIEWRVATDPGLRRVVARGTQLVGPGRDFCCKVIAQGLSAGTGYYYEFRAGRVRSATGRTRTAIAGGAERLRFAIASCQSIQQGRFAAWRHIARERLDAVLFLGDYIYEYGDQTGGRIALDPPHEILSPADYRRRYAFYRLDPALREAHRLHPFIAVWDDHETANNAWHGGAQNHDPATEGDFWMRHAGARQAWLEWMPVREPAADGPIHRALRFGELADLLMLDTRIEAREQQARRSRDIAANPARELIGKSQEHWLLDELAASQQRGTAWRLVGQQVIFSTLGDMNPDQWDGYPQARTRVLRGIEQHKLRDLVFLTGDIHSAWAIDVAEDPYQAAHYDPVTGRGAVAVEFVVPGISSQPVAEYLRLRDPARLERIERALKRQPHVRFADLDARGYALLEVSRHEVAAEWYRVNDPEDAGSGVRLVHRARALPGEMHIARAT